MINVSTIIPTQFMKNNMFGMNFSKVDRNPNIAETINEESLDLNHKDYTRF